MFKTVSRVAVAACLLLAPVRAASQGTAPVLDRQQRATLLDLVTAVTDSPVDPTPDADWPVHLFRTSDGSHYIAFSAPMPEGVDESAPLAVYVRLAPRTGPGLSASVQRSAVHEWLRGERSDPLPLNPRRVVQVPTGEMPAGGLSATFMRDGGAGQNSAALRLMELQRERARDERESRERQRREEMEGRAENASMLLPFEDFDMAARITVAEGRPSTLRRAVTAGPGHYDLAIAWATLDATHRPTATGVLRRALDLPADPAQAFVLGSVVVADAIRTRGEPFGAAEQASHPYAIGTMEIDPSIDRRFTNEDRLFAAFQVINASPSPTGKPDVSIAARLIRKTSEGDEAGATLSPLRYNESTLPVDFDLRAGHPILAAMAAPLRGLARGEYRLLVSATDGLARTTATAEAAFHIAATPQVLLAAAPPFRPAFRRDTLLEARVLGAWLDALAPPNPSPALAGLIAKARESRFAALVPDVTVPDDEAEAVLLLQALGYFALGDNSVAVCSRTRRAAERGAPMAPSRLLLGACAAMNGQDADAVTAWRLATAGNIAPAVMAVPLGEALARLGRLDEASVAARTGPGAPSGGIDLARIRAAAAIDTAREADAIRLLEPFLGARPIDTETHWLALHALFASFVRGEGPGAGAEGRARFGTLADAYIAAHGRWQDLAAEWAAVVAATSSVP